MTQFLSLNSDDATNTKTLLYESIPLTGTVISGTYSDENIKNYTHGMFQSVYDYPYLSSSANHIFDITMGYHSDSVLSSSTATQNSKKINIYNQMSLVLLGASASGDIQPFETDLTQDKSGQALDGYFVNLSRLITKDQIKKGTFSLELGRGAWATAHSTTITLQDLKASTSGDGTLSTIGGDYGVLFDTTASATTATNTSSYGVVFYQAGIAVLSSSIWDEGITLPGYNQFSSGSYLSGGAGNMTPLACSASIATSSISGTCDALRHRITNLTFNNSTEINSTIYFCRLPVNKFNYSTNPTYTSGSKIRVKNNASDLPVAYASTVGLYNAQNELLAVAKLSEPLKKTPQNELTIRVRLDY